jgi:CRP/FNR family transcriptional regulator
MAMKKLVSVFEKHGNLLKARKGRILFGVDDPPTKMYLVKSGTVKIYRCSEDGKEVMIHVHGPGELVTISPLFKEMSHIVFAETLVNSELYWILTAEFKKLAKNDPEILFEIGELLAINWDTVEERMGAFVTLDSLGRLAYMIQELANKYGVRQSPKVMLPFPLTHQDLASLTGMFRETVSIGMQELKKAEIVSTNKQVVVIDDIDRLNKCASLGRQALP